MTGKQQSNMFGKTIAITPKTQGIKYVGSKLKILPHIIELVGDLRGVNKVLDGFTGTTRVAQALAQLSYSVTASDVSAWSEVFANCYLKSKREDKFYQEILNHLNGLAGYDGWYTEHYGAGLSEGKRPFQQKNTRKLDAIRDEIEKLNLSWIDKCVVLTSLIYALDCIDSTLGHYVSYLAHWSPRSHNDLFLKLPIRFPSAGHHNVVKGDIFQTIMADEYDLAYFDPPYGSNNEKMPPSRVRYASYYHIWTTIIKHDKPLVFGKVNRREDSRDTVAGSVFEEFRKDEGGSHIAMQALRRLVAETKARYILLSYSSGGRATKQELNDIINESGKLIKAIEVNYKQNVMANMRWTHEWINSDGKHHEYLFLMEKSPQKIWLPVVSSKSVQVPASSPSLFLKNNAETTL